MDKEVKVILILSAIGFVLGAIIGAITGGVGSAFMGMWVGIGIGGALSFLSSIPGMFMLTLKEDGFGEAIKVTFFGCIIWLVIFMIGGPIALLVRLLIVRPLMKKIQAEKAARKDRAEHNGA